MRAERMRSKKVPVGAAEVVDRERRMQKKGVAGKLRIGWPALMRFKPNFTDPFSKAREDGLKRAGVETFHGVRIFWMRTPFR
jgi:glutathione reductase (NADPH)